MFSARRRVWQVQQKNANHGKGRGRGFWRSRPLTNIATVLKLHLNPKLAKANSLCHRRDQQAAKPALFLQPASASTVPRLSILKSDQVVFSDQEIPPWEHFKTGSLNPAC
jgi:hypothetical protein